MTKHQIPKLRYAITGKVSGVVKIRYTPKEPEREVCTR